MDINWEKVQKAIHKKNRDRYIDKKPESTVNNDGGSAVYDEGGSAKSKLSPSSSGRKLNKIKLLLNSLKSLENDLPKYDETDIDKEIEGFFKEHYDRNTITNMCINTGISPEPKLEEVFYTICAQSVFDEYEKLCTELKKYDIYLPGKLDLIENILEKFCQFKNLNHTKDINLLLKRSFGFAMYEILNPIELKYN